MRESCHLFLTSLVAEAEDLHGALLGDEQEEKKVEFTLQTMAGTTARHATSVLASHAPYTGSSPHISVTTRQQHLARRSS